jgi:hypothetical protein
MVPRAKQERALNPGEGPAHLPNLSPEPQIRNQKFLVLPTAFIAFEIGFDHRALPVDG